MLRVIGAGLPRTGTASLQNALTTLLGGPCYHMIEVFERPEHVRHWQEAADTGTTDWDAVFDGYAAAVDWPASAFWPQLAEKYPDALILLSTRTSGAAWWKSVSNTILPALTGPPPDPSMAPWFEMIQSLQKRFAADNAWHSEDSAVAYYDRYIAEVRRTAPAGRFLEWSAPQGWEPICTALGLPVPDEPFPHLNSTEDFNRRIAEANEAQA